MINEVQLLELVNEHLDMDVYLENYQKINLYVYNEDVLKEIIKAFKFKDIGNIYDYQEELGVSVELYISQSSMNYDSLERILVSEKNNAVMNYTGDNYCISCSFLIDTSKVKKFLKKINAIIRKDTGVNMFKDIQLDCELGEYIEISNTTDSKTRMVDVVRHTLEDEKLVFDKDSVINEVMTDINMFFKDKTAELYKKLNIPYKRGVILYGEPGNGKSAMIRELIRTIPKISKIIINAGIRDLVHVLVSLIKALKGRPAIIIIEDIEAAINLANRSDLLNALDGLNVITGAFLIGTTNYLERIDPAFVNRGGRFDRTYRIDNPGEAARKAFFKSRKLHDILSYYKVYKDDSKEDTDDGIIELFVKYSGNMPMANIKELVTSTVYLLATNNEMSIEEALEKTYNVITNNRAEHVASHNAELQKQNNNGYRPQPVQQAIDDDEYDEDEE